MKYFHPRKLRAMIITRGIKTNSPIRSLGLHVRPGEAGVCIMTLDNAGIDVSPALGDSVSWDTLAEKLPNWISKYSIGGIVVSHLPESSTASRFLKEQHDLVEKLSKVKGIEDGMPYTFVQY